MSRHMPPDRVYPAHSIAPTPDYAQSIGSKGDAKRLDPTRSSAVTAITACLCTLLVAQPIAVVALNAAGIRGFALASPLNLVSGLLCGSILLYACISELNGRTRLRMHPLLAAISSIIFCIILAGLIVGLSLNNSPLYTVSDTGYFSIWLCGIVCGAFASMHITPVAVDRILSAAATLFCIGAAVSIGLLFTTGNQPTSFILRWCILYLAAAIFVRRLRHPLPIALAIMLLTLTFSSLNRAALLILPAALITAAASVRKGTHVTAAVTVATLLTYSSLGTLVTLLPIDSQIHRRLAETQALIEGRATLQNSLASLQRVYEARLVQEEMGTDPTSIIFGLGSGATINGRALPGAGVYTASALGLEKLHNIHFLHTAFYFRHGMIGLAVLAALATAAILSTQLNALRIHRGSISESEHALRGLAILHVVGTIVFAATASNYLFSDPLFGLALGLALPQGIPGRTTNGRARYRQLARRAG